MAWLLIPIFLALAGCASLPESISARPVAAGASQPPGPDEVIIFGRILFIENGQSKLPYGLGKPLWQVSTPETRIETPAPRRKVIPLLATHKDGFFAYVIPAGRYQMSHVEPFYYLPMIDPALEFDAGAPGHAYYLGDLEVDIDATSWIGGLWGNYITHLNHLEVLDQLDAGRRQLEELLAVQTPVEKALLHRIHGRFPALMENKGGMLVAPSGSIRFGR